MTHDDLQELLGAYALDAVDADEAAAVEEHLADCPRCRAEVADLRETAALLAHSGTDAPAGVWDRIAAELHDTPPPLRLEVRRGERASSQLDARRRTLQMVGMAAAAAVIVVLAFSVQRLSSQVDDLKQSRAAASSSSSATVELAAAANRALTEPGARIARLSGGSGQTQLAAVAVVRANGQGYFLGEGLPALAANGKGRVYELWGATESGQIAALGTVSGPGVWAFTVDPSVHVVMVTEEAGPVAAPTSPALVTGTLS